MSAPKRQPNRAAGGHARTKSTTPEQRRAWGALGAQTRRAAAKKKWGLPD